MPSTNTYASDVNEVQSGTAVISRFTSTSATDIFTSNLNRVMLTVYNEGPENLFVRCASAASSAPSATNYDFIVPQGFYLECDWYNGPVSAAFAAGLNSVASITEYR